MLAAMTSALDLDGAGPKHDYEDFDSTGNYDKTGKYETSGKYETTDPQKYDPGKCDPIYPSRIATYDQFDIKLNTYHTSSALNSTSSCRHNYQWNIKTDSAAASSYPSPVEDLDQWVPHMTPYNFLVVDDNEINLRILSRMLRKLYPRATVRTVQHSAAVETTEAALLHFDIIFLDIEMPYVTGTDIAARVRCLKELDHVALVAVTTRCSDLDLKLYRQVGFDYTIAKPLENHNYIQHKVEQVLGMFALRR